MLRRNAKPESSAEAEPRPSVVPGVERNVFILGVVSFFTDISSEAVYPLVPIFLTKTLGAPLAVVGAIEGVAEGTASVVRWLSGWFSDRLGQRKPFVVLGYGLAAVAKPLLALAFHWPVVLFARFVDRFGKGVRTAPRDALVAQWTERGERGRAFGFHRAVDTAGAVLGPLGALALLALLGENFRLIFVLAFIPAVLGMVLLRLVAERTPQPAAAAAAAQPQGRRPAFRARLLRLLHRHPGLRPGQLQRRLPHPALARSGSGRQRGGAGLCGLQHELLAAGHARRHRLRSSGSAQRHRPGVRHLRCRLPGLRRHRRRGLRVAALPRLRGVHGPDRGRGPGAGRRSGARRAAGFGTGALPWRAWA